MLLFEEWVGGRKLLIRSVGFHEHRYVKLRVVEKAHEAVVSSFILGQTMTIITGVSAWFNVREVCFISLNHSTLFVLRRELSASAIWHAADFPDHDP